MSADKINRQNLRMLKMVRNNSMQSIGLGLKKPFLELVSMNEWPLIITR
jgi:hypothetical protein